jgi:hypothetical protein
MTNHIRESREKQMNKKIEGMEPFRPDIAPYLRSEPMRTEHILGKEVLHHDSIQLLAYQIYLEKGGNALDNWLEAERILKYNYRK